MSYQFLLTPFFLEKEKPELNSIREKNWIVNKPAVNGNAAHGRVKEVHNFLLKEVRHILEKGQTPVHLGGDCCMSIPIMGALQQSGLSPIILWLDAHGDFNTDEITLSGFLGGMPLAMFSGRGDQQFLQNAGVKPLADEDIVLTDARDLDPAEKELIESSGINWLKNIRDIKRFDFRNRPVFIHFDVDILDASETPALLYPVANGPRVADIADLFRYLQQTQTICAISVTCWEPVLDKDNKTARICKELLSILTGVTLH